MAERPLFIPVPQGPELVRKVSVEFHWYPGMALSQKQKSIDSLHAAATGLTGISRLLEISTKSRAPLGVALSGFNLMLGPGGKDAFSVECAFQGSKVFERGGPFEDLFAMPVRLARKDGRLTSSGELTGFRYLGTDWGPATAFYDWLYIGALHRFRDEVKLTDYEAFTDIEYTPARSTSCQAHSVALYVALQGRGQLEEALSSRAAFLEMIKPASSRPPSGSRP